MRVAAAGLLILKGKGVFMRYFKMVGLCLAAVFVMSAVVVASASAEGALFLFPNATNQLQDFSSKTGGAKLVQKNGAELSCLSATNTGEAVGHSDKVEKVLIVLRECATKILGETKKCTSPGQPAGIVKTNQLSGNLGLLNKAGEAEKVGLVLKAEEPTGLFAEFECGAAIKVKVRGREISSTERGGLIGEVLPGSVEKLIDPGEAVFLTCKKGTEPWEQQWKSLTTLGALVDELLLETSIDGSAFELAAVEATENISFFFLESVRILS
jgi:hypothetical protein